MQDAMTVCLKCKLRETVRLFTPQVLTRRISNMQDAMTVCHCGIAYQAWSPRAWRDHMNSDEHYRRTQPEAWAEEHRRPYDSQGSLPGAWTDSFIK